MGANMLIASVPDNHGRTLEELEAIIDALTPEQASVIFHSVERDSYEEMMSYEPETDITELEYVQGKLRFAVNAIRGGASDVTYITHGGTVIWLTGGPSWGDDPTEVFSPLIYLAEADIL